MILINTLPKSDIIQGYYYSKPLMASEAEVLLLN